MKILNIDNSFDYEMEKLARLFLPFEKIEVVHDSIYDETRFAVCRVERESNGANIYSSLTLDGQSAEKECFCEKKGDFEKECQLSLGRMLYDCFAQISDYRPAWGILTGVRPARLYSRKEEEFGADKVKDYFLNNLYVSDRKISLCKTTVKTEKAIIDKSDKDSFSLYLSIPFCPTRCSYCSFVSHSVESARQMIPQYVELLCRELEYTAELSKSLGLKLKTVYMGGGTPTTLDAMQLDTVLSTVRKYFDFSDTLEFTVEAGRPDTVTKDKLLAIKNNGVNRISINPQTLNDDVLKYIGRNHTAKQMIDAFNLAQSIGFTNINTDLIAGLPTDTLESFKNTVDGVISLGAPSITVHSLSMKRASTLNQKGSFPEIGAGILAESMVEYARDKLTQNGILPYYMYRQSKTVGNLENVGYSKKGFEGLYNVFIMDETHTILACGASAVTKLRQAGGDNIERIFNFKYPYEYIDRFDEQLKRKDKVIEFYKKYPLGV